MNIAAWPLFYTVPVKPSWEDIPEMLRPTLPINKDFVSTGTIRLVNKRIEIATTFSDEILLTKNWPPKVFSDGWTTPIWTVLPVGAIIWQKIPGAEIDVILPMEVYQ